MAGRYQFSEEEIKAIEQKRRGNKDKCPGAESDPQRKDSIRDIKTRRQESTSLSLLHYLLQNPKS